MINAGGVFFELRFNRDQLQSFIREVRNARRQIDDALNRGAGAGGFKLIDPADQGRVKQAVQDMGQLAARVRQLAADTRQLADAQRAGTISAEQLGRLRQNVDQLRALGQSADLAGSQVREVVEALSAGVGSLNRFSAGVDPATANVRELGTEIENLVNRTNRLLRQEQLGSIGGDFSELRLNIELMEQLARTADLTNTEMQQVNSVLDRSRGAFSSVRQAVDPVDDQVKNLSAAVRTLRNDFISYNKTADVTENEMRELITQIDRLRNSTQLTARQTQTLAAAQATGARTIAGINNQVSRLGIAYQTNLALQQQFGGQLFRFGAIGQVAGTGLNAASGALAKIGPGAALATTGVIGLAVAFGTLTARGIPELARVEDALNVLRASGERNVDAVIGRLDALVESGGRAVRQFSRSDLANSVAELVKAGVSAGEALDIVAQGAQLAAAEQQDLATSNALLLQNLRQFNFGADDTVRVADAIAQASLLAASGARELQEGLATVGPVAAAANVEFEEALALLVNLDNKGLNAADRGATGLRNTLDALASPTKAARQFIEGFGIALENADGSVRPVRDVLFDLKDALVSTGVNFNELTGEVVGSSEALRAAANIFDTRGVTAILALDGSTDQYRETILGATGILREWSDLMSQGTRQAQERLKAATDDLALSFASALGPAIQGVLAGLTSVVSAMTAFFDLFASEERKFARRIATLDEAAKAFGDANTRGGLYGAVVGVSNLLQGEARQAWADYALEVIRSTDDVIAAADLLERRFISLATIPELLTRRSQLEARQAGLEAQQRIQGVFEPLAIPPATNPLAETFGREINVDAFARELDNARASIDEAEASLVNLAAAGGITEDALREGREEFDSARRSLEVYQGFLDAVTQRQELGAIGAAAYTGALANLADVLDNDVSAELLSVNSLLEAVNSRYDALTQKVLPGGGRKGGADEGGRPSFGGGGGTQEKLPDTIEVLFQELEAEGIAAQRRAEAFIGTTRQVQAEIESVQARASLVSKALEEVFNPRRNELGAAFQASADQVDYLVERLVALEAELEGLQARASIAAGFEELRSVGFNLDQQVQAGIIEPLDAAEGKLDIVRGLLEQLRAAGEFGAEFRFLSNLEDRLVATIGSLETVQGLLRPGSLARQAALDYNPILRFFLELPGSVDEAAEALRLWTARVAENREIQAQLDFARAARAVQEGALETQAALGVDIGQAFEAAGAPLESVTEDVVRLEDVLREASGSLVGLGSANLASLLTDVRDLRVEQERLVDLGQQATFDVAPLQASVDVYTALEERILAAITASIALEDQQERAARALEVRFGNVQAVTLAAVRAAAAGQGQALRTVEDVLRFISSQDLLAGLAGSEEFVAFLEQTLPSAAEESVQAAKAVQNALRAVGEAAGAAVTDGLNFTAFLQDARDAIGELDRDELKKLLESLERLRLDASNPTEVSFFDQIIADAERAQRATEATIGRLTETDEGGDAGGDVGRIFGGNTFDLFLGEFLPALTEAERGASNIDGRFEALRGTLASLSTGELADIVRATNEMIASVQGTEFEEALTQPARDLLVELRRIVDLTTSTARTVGVGADRRSTPLARRLAAEAREPTSPEDLVRATVSALEASRREPIRDFAEALEAFREANIQLDSEFEAALERLFDQQIVAADRVATALDDFLTSAARDIPGVEVDLGGIADLEISGAAALREQGEIITGLIPRLSNEELENFRAELDALRASVEGTSFGAVLDPYIRDWDAAAAATASARQALLELNEEGATSRTFETLQAIADLFDTQLTDFLPSGFDFSESIGFDEVVDRFAELRGNVRNLSTLDLAQLRDQALLFAQTFEGTNAEGIVDPLIADLDEAIRRALGLRTGLEDLGELYDPQGSFQQTFTAIEQAFGPITDVTTGIQAAANYFRENAKEGLADFIENLGLFFDEEERRRGELEKQQAQNFRKLEQAFRAGEDFARLLEDVIRGDLGSPTDDPAAFAQGLLGGAGGVFSGILGVINPLAGAVAGLVTDLGAQLIGLFDAIFDPNGRVARQFRDSVFDSISGGLSSALTEFVNGDLTTEELEAKLYESVRGSVASALLDSLVNTALIEGALRPILERLGRAVAEGRTQDIAGIVAEVVQKVKLVVPTLVSAAQDIKDAFDSALPPGLDLDDDIDRTLFALPEATTLGLTEAGNILTELGSTIPAFSNATERLTETFNNLVDEGIRVRVDSGGGVTPQEVRA